MICVGKLKEKYWLEAMAEYTKRLGKYCTFSVSELKEEKVLTRLSEADTELVKQREGEAIISRIKKGSFVIALDIRGKMLSSEELADKIRQLGVEGNSSITFIIGGPLGLSPEVITTCDFAISFSAMTFTHQLMRIILAEQVYRAFKIIKNEAYHK